MSASRSHHTPPNPAPDQQRTIHQGDGAVLGLYYAPEMEQLDLAFSSLDLQ